MKERLKIITKNDAETKKLGEKLARKIVGSRTSNKKALVISLEGDLGAGKTTFTQGFAKGLGVKETPKSPTFVIMQTYAIRHKPHAIRRKAYGLRQFIHVDAYRLNSKDFKALNWKNFINDPKNIILVEWGNKIKNILPKNSLVISFGHTRLDSSARQVGHVSNRRLIKINQ